MNHINLSLRNHLFYFSERASVLPKAPERITLYRTFNGDIQFIELLFSFRRDEVHLMLLNKKISFKVGASAEITNPFDVMYAAWVTDVKDARHPI